MYIANLSISYKNPPTGFPDRFALQDSAKKDLYRKLLDQNNIKGAIILQTCNRFEVYFTDDTEARGIEQAKSVILNAFGEDIKRNIITNSYLDTVKHLYRVVSSLESMVIGENQILAQCKEAFKYASKFGFTNRILNMVFTNAIKLGKKARADTQISNGKVSISSVAVDMVGKISTLENKRVLLIGTGNMATLVAEYLGCFKLTEMIVVGRTPEKVLKFCEDYGGQASNFKELPEKLKQVDIVFSATSAPKILVDKDLIKQAMENRDFPMIIVDIAVPSDVDPTASDIKNVQVYSIEDLRDISKQNIESRMNEIHKVEDLIEFEYKKFADKIQNLHIERYFATISKYAESIRCSELEKAIGLLGNTHEPKVKQVLEGLSKSLIKKLMHNFLSEIRTNPYSEEEMKKLTEIFMGCSEKS